MIPWTQLILRHERQTHGTERLVLLALAGRANESGHCWPSIATIAQEAGCSERRAHDALRKLINEHGLVKLDSEDGRVPQELTRCRPDRRPNYYLLTLDGIDISSPSSPERGGRSVSNEVDDPSSREMDELSTRRIIRKEPLEEPAATSTPSSSPSLFEPPAARTRTRVKDPIFEKCCELEGRNPRKLTPRDRGKLNRATAEFKAKDDVTPGEMDVRAGRYRRKWPDWHFSALALADHWHELAPQPERRDWMGNVIAQ